MEIDFLPDDLWSQILEGGQHGIRCRFTTAVTPEGAEAAAALLAVTWEKEKGIRRLHLEGDCSNVIKAINGARSSVNWQTNSWIEDIIVILNSSFDYWPCSFDLKEANNAAHKLEKHAISNSSSEIWFDQVPGWLNECIQ